MDVALSVDSVLGPTIAMDSDGTSIACVVVVRADGTGSSEATATWKASRFFWYDGPDRSAPADTIPVTAAMVQDGWGSSKIGAGEFQRSRWGFRSSQPFEVVLEFTYMPAAGVDALRTATRFACGPAVDSTTPPPMITEMTTTAPAGELATGGVLEVRYTARSDGGVLQTSVALSGPCAVTQAFWEDLGITVSRTARMVLPPQCVLGVPVVATVGVLDGASRTATRMLATGLSLVDRTPPSLHIPYYYGPYGSVESYAGTFFTGEVMSIIAWAADNHRLASIVWEVRPAGVRDSLRVDGTSVDTVVRIRVRPDWNGPIQLRLWARDSTGNTSDTIVSLPDSLLVFPTVEHPYRVINTYGASMAARVDTLRQRALLLQQGWQRVLALDLATGAEVGSVGVPDYPTAFDGSPGGDSLIVMLPNIRALAVVDLRDLSRAASIVRLTTLDSARGDVLWHLAVASNGKVFTSWHDRTWTVTGLVEVDLRTGAERQRTDVGIGGLVGYGDLRSSLDHTALWLAANSVAQRYDPALDTFGAGVASAIPSSMDLSGSHAAIGLRLYDAALQYQRTAWSPDALASTAATLSVDGGTLFYSMYQRGLLRARVSDGALLERASAPGYVESLWPSADGKTLVGIVSGGGTIVLIDLR